jgi:transposase-like protein
MIAERGVMVDHSTIHRWAIKMLPGLAAVSSAQRPVGKSWRMDETYVKVGGQWKYLYRAVDKDGDTTDVLLRAKRDHAAARAFFEAAIDLHDLPENITIDKSGSKTAAIVSFQADSGFAIELRQSKYLNNIVEQDRLAIKRIARSMLG